MLGSLWSRRADEQGTRGWDCYQKGSENETHHQNHADEGKHRAADYTCSKSKSNQSQRFHQSQSMILEHRTPSTNLARSQKRDPAIHPNNQSAPLLHCPHTTLSWRRYSQAWHFTGFFSASCREYLDFGMATSIGS